MHILDRIQGGWFRELVLGLEKVSTIVPDAMYLKIMYRIRVGKKLNLKNPTTISEKLQWLKLYNRQDIYTRMVDKYEVKQWVADKIGSEHVIPTIGVWDNFDDIPFDEFPEQFVLKCTHDSGSVIICKDKSTFDVDAARKRMKIALKRNGYWKNREWPYKNVRPRLIAEPYLKSLANPDSKEYKITCFDGKLGFGTICSGPAHRKLSERKNDFYDPDFKSLPFWSFYEHSDNPITEKPAHYDEMVKYAEILSEGIPYLRVDFYLMDDVVYFGENTFFTWGGFLKFEPAEWDEKLGEMLKLPVK